jgi:hypothetical protein
VLALDVADIVRHLIEILDGELGSIAVRSDGDEALVVELEVGKDIEPGEAEVAGGEVVGEAVEADPELISQIRAEGVVFREREKVVAVGLGGKEGRQIGSGILSALGIEDVTETERVSAADGVIGAGGEGVEVGKGGGQDVVVAERDVGVSTGSGNGEVLRTGGLVEAGVVSRGVDTSAASAGKVGGRGVLLILSEVVGAEAFRGRNAVEGGEACGGRGAEVVVQALADGVALIVGEEEELVAEDGSAELAAIAIVVVTAYGSLAPGNTACRVEIAGLEVLMTLPWK